ncbi:MAG: radical SAM protein [Bacillota bacterium]|nr:radical SAM protein [Bacillota bacterium]
MRRPAQSTSNGRNRDGSKHSTEYLTAIGKDRRLALPPDIVTALGLSGGEELRVVVNDDRVEVLPGIHNLGRLYIEPTSACNLSCQTCIRNSWSEPVGEMDMALFDRLADQLTGFSGLQSVMFGGFGEPTCHKDIPHMIRAIKSLGLRVEMTTNGTLLSETMLRELLDSKMDTIWVSFDGTGHDSFDSIREGASFDRVVQNLRTLKVLHERSGHKIQIGIAFVAMKRNVDDLRHLSTLARSVGAKTVSVSNVLPYSRDMQEQMLCNMVLTDNRFLYGPGALSISLPLLDVNQTTKEPIFSLLRSGASISVMSNRIGVEGDTCRFIWDRCTFVRWDGAVSPCMGLLHPHVTYSSPNQPGRSIKGYTLGNIASDTLRRRTRRTVLAILFRHVEGACGRRE